MIHLVFAACLLTAPDHCTTRMVPTFQNSDTSCLNSASGTLAIWEINHPEWTVVEWACAKKRDDAGLPNLDLPNS